MEIQREIVHFFKSWKDSEDRKPILLMGARQIGKTWAIESFGRECFEYTAVFNFDKQPEVKSVFQTSKDPERILRELVLYCDVPLVAGKTLLVFDEIQECEEALNSLKYFCEDAPAYHVVAAGSLLGVAVRKRKMTVPVGKVKVVRMFPVSFMEFLREADSKVFDYVCSLNKAEHLPAIILNKLILEYKRYMVCGGMPEAVKAMLENRGVAAIDDVLQGILDMYELDFSKYADSQEIPRIKAIWKSLPSQLAKENRKFIYKVVNPSARSKDYEDSLLWLESAGMIQRVFNISKPSMPLSAYSEPNVFKVYACDCGLLRRLAKLPAGIIMDPVANYTEFKGAMAENAVLQSLLSKLDVEPYYWSPDSRAEVEFVIQWNEEIIPIEVKAENCISGKSLSVYHKKYAPKHRVRFSFLNLQENEGLLSIPAPLVELLEKMLLKR